MPRETVPPETGWRGCTPFLRFFSWCGITYKPKVIYLISRLVLRVSPINARCAFAGEELPNGRVRCPKCGRACTSRQGLAVHYGKAHVQRPPKPKPEPRQITLQDLREGRFRL